jgi:Ca2+-binding EF-hand superfamily protein
LPNIDKDRDGILSREEMAECLQQVLKRKITFEEAMEIANTIVSAFDCWGCFSACSKHCIFAFKDENKDGVFTVQELIHWIETNKLVKLVEEGRDADVDRIVIELKTSDAERRETQEVSSQAVSSK